MAGDKILVVDDSRSIRDTFAFSFDEYNIITAGNGQEALDILNRPNDIDLIVLDVMMPDINGLELLNKIKEKNKECKIIIMTGYGSKDVAIKALRGRADDYIEKPFDIDTVKKIFENLLGKKRAQDRGYNSKDTGKIVFAKRLVDRNYNRTISLGDISKEVFLDYKYLSRVFKEKIGNGFNEYKLKLKISSAKELLAKSGYTVSQIAYKVGYQNPSSFMKMFKKITGVTPSEYRRANGRKNARRRRSASNERDRLCRSTQL